MSYRIKGVFVGEIIEYDAEEKVTRLKAELEIKNSTIKRLEKERDVYKARMELYEERYPTLRDLGNLQSDVEKHD